MGITFDGSGSGVTMLSSGVRGGGGGGHTKGDDLTGISAGKAGGGGRIAGDITGIGGGGGAVNVFSVW